MQNFSPFPLPAGLLNLALSHYHQYIFHGFSDLH
jgi:hypothetical protein